MKYILAPSILAADFTQLGRQMKEAAQSGAAYVHFDVMDGMFVPNISFGVPVLESIRKATDQVFDAHLMVKEPIRYVEAFANAGADLITVHYEACEDLDATLQKIRDCGKKVGIAISPDTPVEVLHPYLEQAEMFLIMSVYPGFGGQKFIPESLDRIRTLRNMLNEKNLQANIQVDGGIYLANVTEVLDAGANVIVAGSAVFKGSPADNTKAFMEILKKYE